MPLVGDQFRAIVLEQLADRLRQALALRLLRAHAAVARERRQLVAHLAAHREEDTCRQALGAPQPCLVNAVNPIV